MKVVAVCTASKEREVIGRYCRFAARNQVLPLAADCLWESWEEKKEGEVKDEQEKGKKSCEMEAAYEGGASKIAALYQEGRVRHEEMAISHQETAMPHEKAAMGDGAAVFEGAEIKSMAGGEPLQVQKKNMERRGREGTKQNHTDCHQKTEGNHGVEKQKAEKQELKAAMNYELLSRCDELWVFGSPISMNMKEMIKMGMRLKKPMLYFNHRCELLLDLVGLKGEF